MAGSFWTRRRPIWFAGGLTVAIVTLTVWLLRTGSGVNVATVLALPISIASLAVAAWGLSPSPPLSRVARDLAGRVSQERGQARRQALGMTGDARPADLRFRSPTVAGEPELVRWRADGGPGCGTLRDVAGFYRSLDRGRMVIIGEPGAGKTVLATQLVIDLIQALPDGELQSSARPPVPVWLSLTSANLGESDELSRIGSEELSGRLNQWIAAQVSVTYQVTKPTAERLIREGWVLPVLDGMDEMDAPGTGPSGSPRPRAAAVVRALNAGTGRRPVVLVCRRGAYGQLARSAPGTPEDPVLQDATQIVLQPLEEPEICDYLTRRFPAGQPGLLATRWQSVQTTLRANASDSPGTLAAILSSPWRLFLAATAYYDDGTDPGELTRLSPDRVPRYLLGQLIPAVSRLTPSPGGKQYPPDKVRNWLTSLAVHLDQTSSNPRLQWSPTDLRMQGLWSIAGRKTVQWLTALTVIVLVGIATAFGGLLEIKAHGIWDSGTAGRIAQGATSVSILVLTALSIIDTNPSLSRLSLKITPGGSSRRRLAVGLAGWLAAGLALGLASGLALGLTGTLTDGPAVGLAIGLAIGLAAWLAFGLAGNFSLAAKPTTVMRENVAFVLVVVVGCGLLGGLAVGLASALGGVVPGGLAVGLAAGLTGGLVLGLVLGLMLGLVTWIRYVIGCMLARRRGMLPPRVGQFLDWAYHANLLRMSGTAMQFRHRELQTWLSESAQN